MLLKLVILFLAVGAIAGQIYPPSGFRRVRPGRTVLTGYGPLQGQEETYDIFRRIYTYKGIPYAQPPIGNLRFKQPEPALPTPLLRQAWDYGSRCPQRDALGRMVGDEDCLYLNIATPTNIRAPLPVAVFIHGGSLQFGSGQIDFLGPEYINQEGVVWVSINYRLNVFGFLNTADQYSPGNYGIKDMIQALRWVRDNIEAFGGNPNDVTIIGPSGGAVAVHSLVVSPAASGLFHKAVANSGTLFNYFSFNRDPRQNVLRLVDRLKLQVTSSQDTVEQLRKVSVLRLLSALPEFETPNFHELEFMPSLDPINSLEPRVLTAPIEYLVRFGRINSVPFLIGFNSAEMLPAINSIRDDPTILERFNQNPNLLVPLEWNIQPNSPQALEVIAAFRNLYFGGAQIITQDMALQWSDYVSDREFIFGISKMARLHRARQNVYYFRFSYKGSLSFAQRTAGLTEYPGAMHGDDAFYLYRMNRAVTPILPGDEAFIIQRQFVRMWTNFFRFGNPTPSSFDTLLGTQWPLMTENEEFLDIGWNLQPDVKPFQARMNVWHAFDERFSPYF